MVKPTRPPANGFVRVMRRVYNAIGFSKGYNAVLFVVFAGALMGFTLARFSYLDFYGVLCRPDGNRSATNNAAPGECFYLLQSPYTAGMIIHLAAILPASFLACFQFVPAIRHKILIVHRVNGSIIVLLSIISVAGALMITRHSFGGGLDVQSSIGFLAIIFLVSNFMAYINIKRLQIEQHRAWMMRAWCYAGSVVTTRFVLFSGAAIVSKIGGFFYVLPCAKVAWLLLGDQDSTLSLYPECAPYFNGDDVNKQVAVLGSLYGTLPEATSALDMTFGTAHWLALLIHVIGVEIYLHLTPAEHERLRQVSYQRQLEAGLKNPGRSGWTTDRFGDAEKWTAKTQVRNMRIDSEDSFQCPRTRDGASKSSCPDATCLCGAHNDAMTKIISQQQSTLGHLSELERRIRSSFLFADAPEEADNIPYGPHCPATNDRRGDTT